MNLNHLFLLVLISALCGHLHASTPFQLITQLGSVDRRSGKMLASFSDSHGVSIIGVVDFEPGSSASFTNKLFQTNFNSEDRGSRQLSQKRFWALNLSCLSIRYYDRSCWRRSCVTGGIR